MHQGDTLSVLFLPNDGGQLGERALSVALLIDALFKLGLFSSGPLGHLSIHKGTITSMGHARGFKSVCTNPLPQTK